ncbi:nicotinate-nucleotide adenylyltransferase [Gammaproteobacteria bacterium]|nr:nicotinate-nucleotide adenylyltransferase [Gammaproteobacteria bacterium]CAG0940990.1 nicotinate-nucleotide adenylyltransferase [Gammaproteobacteria bacterium]
MSDPLGQGGGPVGVFGGTFDPVHHGHLRTALEVLEGCGLEQLRLVPALVPPHRPQPRAPASLRLEMLRRAVAGEPRLVVDDRELRRGGPSYTVDTLAELRAAVGTRPLCLVLGADAFLGLPGWHRWRELFALAHLVVVERPGTRLEPDAELAAWLAGRRSEDAAALTASSAGLLRMQPVTPLAISASAIRALLAGGGDPRFLVPEAVRELIMASRCYPSNTGPPAGSKEAQRSAKQETRITGQGGPG